MRNVILRPTEDGWWLAEVPSLPGCATQGATRADAIELYIESLEEEGESIPPEVEFVQA